MGGGIDITDAKIVTRLQCAASTYYAVDMGMQASDMHWVVAFSTNGYERGTVSGGVYTKYDAKWNNAVESYGVHIQKVQGTSVYVMQDVSGSLTINVMVG